MESIELQTSEIPVPNHGIRRVGRAEIDTTLPFESVKEAVNLFGGSGVWKYNPKFMSIERRQNFEKVEVAKVEEQATLLEKDLKTKERETLDVLKELDKTKKIVEELKLKLQKEEEFKAVQMPMSRTEGKISDGNPQFEHKLDVRNAFSVAEIHKQGDMNLSISESNIPIDEVEKEGKLTPRLILMELQNAKVNITKTTTELSEIRTSVCTFKKKIEKEKASLEKTRDRLDSSTVKISSLEEEINQTRQKLLETKNSKGEDRENPLVDVSWQVHQVISEAQHFKKMAEVAKVEVQKLMSEIDQTNTSIKMAEVRWKAAKKTEEASRVAEAFALAEIENLTNMERTAAVTLTVEEYSMLINKVRSAEELSKQKIDAAMMQIDEANLSNMEIQKKVDIAMEQVTTSREALEEALDRIESANREKLITEDALPKWRSDSNQRRSDRSIYSSIKFKNSYPAHRRRDSRSLDETQKNLTSGEGTTKPTLSIGQILSRKLLLSEDFENENEDIFPNKKISLAQMLDKKGKDLLPRKVDSNKKIHGKRKKSVFLHFSLLLEKQNRKKKKRQFPVTC